MALKFNNNKTKTIVKKTTSYTEKVNKITRVPSANPTKSNLSFLRSLKVL